MITSADIVCRLFVAWIFNMAFSSLLVGVATWTVVEIAPAAAGLYFSHRLSWRCAEWPLHRRAEL